jgi:hypothetical protein
LDTTKTYRILIVESDVLFLKQFQLILFDLISTYSDIQFIIEFSDELSDSARAVTFPIGLAFVEASAVVDDPHLVDDLTKTNDNMCMALLISDLQNPLIQNGLKNLIKTNHELVIGYIVKHNTNRNLLRATCKEYIDKMISRNQS